MRTKFIRAAKDTQGIIALEALISLMFFMFFMYFIYSYIVMFMAHNVISHALVETAQSLAVESYGIAKLNDGTFQVSDLARRVVQAATDSSNDGTEGEGEFFTHTRWFEGDEDDPNYNHMIGSQSVVEKRFYAYLGGNAEDADKMLKTLRVSNFSLGESRLDGQDLSLVATYDIDLLFKVSLGPVQVGHYKAKQTAVSRLWGKHPTHWWVLDPE